MFNNGKYNLIRFNLASTTKVIWIKRDCAENIDCVAGGRIYKEVSRTATEVIRAVANIVALIPMIRKPFESIAAVATLRKFIIVERYVQEHIINTTYASKTLWLVEQQQEQVLGDLGAGKLIHNKRLSQEIVHNHSYLGKLCPIKRTTTEAIDCETNASSTVYKSFTLQVTIPPGGEVRINSDVFTAMRGLINVLPDFTGDWIWLTRDTVQIKVDSGSGGAVVGEIIYDERYL